MGSNNNNGGVPTNFGKIKCRWHSGLGTHRKVYIGSWNPTGSPWGASPSFPHRAGKAQVSEATGGNGGWAYG